MIGISIGNSIFPAHRTNTGVILALEVADVFLCNWMRQFDFT